jgi:excisionase family DNA binding protein
LREDEYLTVAETAACYKQAESSIRRKIAAGELEAYRLGAFGPLRIPRSAVEAHLRPAAVPAERCAPDHRQVEAPAHSGEAAYEGKQPGGSA